MFATRKEKALGKFTQKEENARVERIKSPQFHISFPFLAQSLDLAFFLPPAFHIFEFLAHLASAAAKPNDHRKICAVFACTKINLFSTNALHPSIHRTLQRPAFYFSWLDQLIGLVWRDVVHAITYDVFVDEKNDIISKSHRYSLYVRITYSLYMYSYICNFVIKLLEKFDIEFPLRKIIFFLQRSNENEISGESNWIWRSHKIIRIAYSNLNYILSQIYFLQFLGTSLSNLSFLQVIDWKHDSIYTYWNNLSKIIATYCSKGKCGRVVLEFGSLRSKNTL